MNEIHEQELRKLVKKAVAPVRAELRRDLWPQMLRRIEQPRRPVPWIDWALAATVTALLLLFPKAIPVLLYHL